MMNLIFRIKRKIYSKFYSPYGEILMLHRVVEERSILEDNRSLEITPAFLEQTILKYKSADYRFVSLDEVQKQLERGKRCYKRKFVCFTLDDGYVDNYEQAYPVFKKHNVPFAIYVTTNFPDKKALLWWYHLQDIVLENKKVKMNGVEYDCSDLEKKNNVYKKLKKIFNTDTETNRKVVEQLFKENTGTVCRDLNRLTLSWKQILEMASDPLCTIAAHTVSHPSLPALSDENIRKELTDGKNKIEEKIKKPVKHFAYPHGNWNNRVAILAMEQYSTAVLAYPSGFIRKGGDRLDRLNRKKLTETESD